MFVQILSASTIRNVWRTLRRIYMSILGLKGLNGSMTPVLNVVLVRVIPVRFSPVAVPDRVSRSNAKTHSGIM